MSGFLFSYIKGLKSKDKLTSCQSPLTLRLGPILEDKETAVVISAYSNLLQEDQEGICGGRKHLLLYSCILLTETHSFTPRSCQHNEKCRMRWLCVVLPPSNPHRKHEGES